ncbi:MULTISPECIES: hypothetical protein [unclassified Tenacibaculum]|uniref:hypothetical protein n=1 Tax=unclassified Tenacibaculum TaxID=2635139 RepID=UPI001F268CEE|nr:MULTISPECIES: hypothetical protein [unclassified Tenacibaculum]MCF2875398.1 hypothetical protein [Tenacibaculum sp. Cn5-1]MCF2935474.1 hypothetical protein [Tenacibaculum sp. Cn5-34]MCG7512034.1 hypothetical protein [Tenacibaculum sp. Cn5-46]
MKNKIAIIAMLCSTIFCEAQTTEYPIKQENQKINNSPWYGLGQSNVIFPSTTYPAMQLAGYYGLLLKTGTGNFAFDYHGRLGIGTTSPQDLLNLHNPDQTSNIGLKITRGNENHGLRLGVNNTHAFLWTTENQNLVLATSDKERLTVTSGGNVGIGTTSPQDLLNLHNSDQTSNIGLKITRGNENHGLRLGVNNSYAFLWTTENQNLVLATSDKERLTVTSGGNVGIGTTNPSAGLEINKGNTNDVALLLKSSGPGWGSGLQLYNLASDKQFGMYSGNDGKWHFTHEGNGDRLVIDNAGNVGIGNSSPSTKLDVGGELKTNWGRLVLRDNSLEEWYTNGPARLAVNYLGYQKGDSQFRDYTIYNGKRVGILHVSGEQESVGIGTENTQGFKLGVNGRIAATEVKVATYAKWPDFVFEKNYNLPTLKEVENHIKEKGHLKNIPDAKEVEKNGFFLGEMDSKLLQKIEELTLYTIEQEKKLNAQKEEIENLKTQNSKIDEQQKKIERLEMLVNKLLKDKK